MYFNFWKRALHRIQLRKGTLESRHFAANGKIGVYFTPQASVDSRGVHLSQRGPGTQKGSGCTKGCKPVLPKSDRGDLRSAGQTSMRDMDVIAKTFAARFAPNPNVVRNRMQNSPVSLTIVSHFWSSPHLSSSPLSPPPSYLLNWHSGTRPPWRASRGGSDLYAERLVGCACSRS